MKPDPLVFLVVGLAFFALFATGSAIYLWLRGQKHEKTVRRLQAERADTLHRLEQKQRAQEEELEKRGETLDEFRRANLAWSRSHEAKERELRSLEGKLEELRRDLVVMRRHTVFLDGMSYSGKTTFIERLTNPTATPEQLKEQISTQYRYHTDPIPLCWEIVDGQRVLHTLEFFDMAGENPEQMVDNILAYKERRLPEQGRAITLVLWDAAAGHPRNVGYFNVGRMKAVFGARVARDVISSYVFFFNKCDLLEEQLRGDPGAGSLSSVLDLQKQILNTEVFEKSLNGYPAPGFAHGSALTGEGVHACLGVIVRHLGLHEHFRRPGESAEKADAIERRSAETETRLQTPGR